MLIDMGNHKNASIRALIATNDNLEAACNWIFENYDKDLTGPIEQEGEASSNLDVDPDTIQQITELGFTKEQATIALLKNVYFIFISSKRTLRMQSNGSSIAEEMSQLSKIY